MAKEDDETTQDPEEDELTRIRETLGKSAFDEATIRKLIQENPDGATAAILAFVKSRAEATSRMISREERRTTREYKAKLAEEFPFANPDSISGTTKKEMRGAAQRAHKHVESILKAAGVEPGTKKPTEAEQRAAAAARGEEWVQAPAGATEVVREAPSVSADQLRSLALSVGGPDAEAKKAEYDRASKGAGVRIITRPSIASALARAAQGREAAKT